MKELGHRIYNIIRSILVTAILSVTAIYVVLYIVLSLPTVQDYVRRLGCQELSKLLGTEVSVGNVQISPFSQVVLDDVCLFGEKGDTILQAEKLGVGVSIFNLLAERRIVFTYAELIGVDGRLSRRNPEEPLNIQFIIDALSPKQKNKPPTQYDLNIRNIVIRRSRFSYDVASADTLEAGQFDANHVAIEDFRADISLPRIKNNDYKLELKRLSFREKSGFIVKNVAFVAEVNDSVVGLSKMRLELPNTLIAPEDMVFKIDGLHNMASNIDEIPIDVAFANNYVSLVDFKAFSRALTSFDFPINFTFALKGTLKKLEIPVFMASAANERLNIELSGEMENIDVPASAFCNIRHLRFSADAMVVAAIISNTTTISQQAKQIIANCGNIGLNGVLKGGISLANFAGNVTTSVGNVTLNGLFANNTQDYFSYTGSVKTDNLDMGRLLLSKTIGAMACNINIDIKNNRGVHDGHVDGKFGFVEIKGYRYNDITANVKLDNKTIAGRVSVNDENGSLSVGGMALVDGKNSAIDVIIAARDVELSKLNLVNKFPGKKLSFDLNALLVGDDLNNITGNVALRNFSYCDSLDVGLHIPNFVVEADNKSMPKTIKVSSDIVDGTVSGEYDLYSLARSVELMLSRPFPALFANAGEGVGEGNVTKRQKVVRPKTGKDNEAKDIEVTPNNLYFNFTVDNVDELADLFKLPVKPLSEVTIDGFITDSNHSLYLLVDAPYLQQKNKLIEGTRLQLSLNNRENNLQVDAHSIIPLKKGKLALAIAANGVNDRIDSNVSWTVDNKMSYSGEVSMSSFISVDTASSVPAVAIDINPTQLLFNDTAWTVHPAHIDVTKRRIAVDDVYITCDKQFIKINGVASEQVEDEVAVELNDINLDYVFETLAIDNVMFGGRATGIFYAADLFSGVPRMFTKGLFVDGLSYNHGLFGDAKILSSWINEDKCVTIQADVAQENGEHTNIDGKIFIARDSLYFDFKPRKANIAFLKPFMSAFSSDISGEASGHAILYGTFKNINLMGDVYADSLRMKVDYTNVYYTARDSVKMRPGLITFNNIELHDPMGNRAYLTGKVTHECFHNATFDFSLTGARNFLGFDITQKMNPEWYGRIFVDGSAFIEGRPGYVNIDINMATADNSSFTFVLSDAKVATEYDFITFVDRSKDSKNKNTDDESRPERVREFLEQQETENSGNPSLFNINLMIEATPQAQMNLVMDPAGGDKIRATGNGNLRIGYNSADEEMSIFGTYTLARGNYNFTLQDIIIKDFTIREGSSLTFNGDPLSAVMNIEAMYSLHANLADLDESFTTDGDLNRTNVPVNALLRLQGDISAPEISFDLEFPTLTSDVYRKVMSIISTEDMMNRQIIYLLALNSFYTPDYVADSSRSSEWASVASSTISSQLSNLLGQMSDNWSISPNFRSDAGDFSDIEVELALSSQLLNNRLLFNGNFGYRDNALNSRNSNFIGDFDIEYLLTKNGNIRLKAYNHYNDQNYYVRSALTTQGVGVVFKHDFDNIHDFLWKRKKKKDKEDADTVATAASGDVSQAQKKN